MSGLDSRLDVLCEHGGPGRGQYQDADERANVLRHGMATVAKEARLVNSGLQRSEGHGDTWLGGIDYHPDSTKDMNQASEPASRPLASEVADSGHDGCSPRQVRWSGRTTFCRLAIDRKRRSSSFHRDCPLASIRLPRCRRSRIGYVDIEADLEPHTSRAPRRRVQARFNREQRRNTRGSCRQNPQRRFSQPDVT